jgi:hypothetical protein
LILAYAVAAQERADYSRIKLRDALRAAIGTDPFTQVTRENERDHQGLCRAVAVAGTGSSPWPQWRAS